MKLCRYEIIRKAVTFLRARPEIWRVRLETASTLHVGFKDGLVEHWSYRPYRIPQSPNHRLYIIPDDDNYPYDNRWPELRSQFTRNPLSDDYEALAPYFMIKPSYLKKFKFCNVRIFIHQFAERLANEGWINLQYPPDLLSKYLDRCRNNVNSIIVQGNHYMEHSRHASASRPVLLTFADLGSERMRQAWNRSALFWAINRLHKIGRDLTRYNILQKVRRWRLIYVGYPMAFAAFLRCHFGGLAVDDDTKSAWVATACLINGIEYCEGGGILVTDSPERWAANDYNVSIFLGEIDGGVKYTLKNVCPWSTPQAITVRSKL